MPDKTIQAINNTQIVVTGFVGFLSWLLAYAKLDVELMSIFAIFMIIDTFFGAVRADLAGVDKSVKVFKMSILIRGIVKKIMLIMLPLMAGAVGAASGKDMSLLTDSVLWLLILKELYSFVSTLHFLTYGELLPEWNILGKIGKGIRTIGKIKDEDA